MIIWNSLLNLYENIVVIYQKENGFEILVSWLGYDDRDILRKLFSSLRDITWFKTIWDGQDRNRKLFDFCRSVQSIDITQFQPTEDAYLNLPYTHDTRIKINNQCMKRFLGSNSGIVIPKEEKSTSSSSYGIGFCTNVGK